MIQANELRIGNFILIDGKLIELTKQKFKVGVITLNCIGLHPIPLTEEWLVRFGFVFNKKTKSFENKDFYIWHISKSIKLDVQNWQVYNYVLKAVANREIKHVHQLQNLYFALTGQELKLNDK